ncbi:MAG: hypothetical protein HKP61_02070 [Dactylosporangium sp.]|nr:hypothetical protein [Dactylosporangium sp.]NNJ59748.1 hypothetical protein [Dactylosporangium sp.]
MIPCPLARCRGRLASVTQQPPDRCRCCGCRTGCTTCPVCFWTEDGRSEENAARVIDGPNGDLTLLDARLNFSIYGASHPRYQSLVRPPRADERQVPGFRRTSRQA